MALEGIRDIKGPVYFAHNRILLIFIIIVILASLLFLLVAFLKKKLKDISRKASLPLKPAHQIAYEALEALRAKNLLQLGKVKEYYFELSNIARHYLENRFLIRAPEMTTEEFLYHLRDSSGLSDEHKNLLKQFLNHCDLVKFAKYGPTEKETDGSFAAAKKLVDETKESKEQRKVS